MDGGMEGGCSKVGTVQRGMGSIAGVEVMEQGPALVWIGTCRQKIVVNLRESEANRSHVHRGRGVGAGRVAGVIEVALQEMVVHCGKIRVPHGVHAVTGAAPPGHQQHDISALVVDALGERNGGVLGIHPVRLGAGEARNLRLVLEHDHVPGLTAQAGVPRIPAGVDLGTVAFEGHAAAGIGRHVGIAHLPQKVLHKAVKTVGRGVGVSVHQHLIGRRTRTTRLVVGDVL